MRPTPRSLPARLGDLGRALAVGVVLVAGRHTLQDTAHTWHDLRSGQATDPTAAPVALVALTAWLLACWLLLLALLAVGLRALQQGQSRGAALLVRLTPGPCRDLVRLCLGLAAATALVSASPALAATPGPGDAPGSAVTLEWPVPEVGSPAPAVAPLPSAPSRPTGPSDPAARSVVVQPGDCLWSLAADALGPRSTPGQVAQEWPRWWAANRAVLGETPDLLHPGTRLLVPVPRPIEES
jgi:hypothetical protein